MQIYSSSLETTSALQEFFSPSYKDGIEHGINTNYFKIPPMLVLPSN
jgi:hypothetical protein